jgi:hypothetical protein
MPRYNKKNNPVTTIQLTPQQLAERLAATAAHEAARRRGADYHTKGYSVPLDRKRRPYDAKRYADSVTELADD